MHRAMKQRDILRHDADGVTQAVLGDARDILAVDQDAAGLRIVEALQQCEKVDLPPPEWPTRPTRSPGREAER